MATLKIEFVSGAQTTTSTKTISGPDLVRFIAAYKTSANIPGATDQQALTHWTDATFKKMRLLTQQIERDTAASAVAEIGMT